MKKIIKETQEKLLSEEKYIYSLSVLIALAGIGLLGWFGLTYFHTDTVIEDVEITRDEQDKNTEDVCEFRRVLDGVCVENAQEKNPQLVAVMVENHLDARPQSGISKASLVYEAPVEGNYSRFLLVYTRGDIVSKVGPVRSARTYYLDWISEFESIMYMHVGGSPHALELIKKYGLFDVNEFYRGWFYWRSTDRYAPHNVYTSSELWKRAWEEYGSDIIQDANDMVQSKGWKFENGDRCIENCVDEIRVTLRAPVYEAVWKYSTTTDRYERFQLGKPHRDEDGNNIYADTIVVQYVDTKVLDEVGRLGMDTRGSGKASVFKNGFEISGTWKKEYRTDKTRFFDESGNEIAFKPGKIWIEVVNQIGGVETNLDKNE